MKRNILYAVLCLALTAPALAGCGNDAATPTQENSEASAVAEDVSSDAEVSSEEEQESSEEEEISLEEVVVLDNEQYTIKVTDVELSDTAGITISSYLENKSAEDTYAFSITRACADGVSLDTQWNSSFPLAPGETMDGREFGFMYSEALLNNGVKCTDLELEFVVYKQEFDGIAQNEEIARETVHVYPYGEENAETYVREDQDTDTIIFDNENIKAVVTGCEQNEYGYYLIHFYMENKSEASIGLVFDTFCINETLTLDAYDFCPYAEAGKCGFSYFLIDQDQLEENGITNMEEISFNVSANGGTSLNMETGVFESEVYAENTTVTFNP